MKLIEVKPEEFASKVNEFYNNSMFTFEGLNINDPKGMELLEKHIKEHGYPKEEVVGYWFTGAMMNEHFKLTNYNEYTSDLIFLVIPDFYNPMYKLHIGARWFDDIVSNNTIRQNSINFGIDADYDWDDEEDDEDCADE